MTQVLYRVLCSENTGETAAAAAAGAADDDDEVITSESEGEADNNAMEAESDDSQRTKRKLKLTEFPDILAKRHKAFQKYR